MANLGFARQDAQLGSTRDTIVGFVDNTTPSLANFETNAGNLATDLNNVRSSLHMLLDNQSSNWYGALVVPSALDTGSARGVNDLNTDLHELERQRFLVPRKLLVDVSVGGADDFVILGAGELPTNTTAAVGAVTTLGTVVAAHAGTFGTHSLDEVGGAHALAPKNLLEITDNAGDPILSSGRRIWGLLQTETATDGHTITDATTTRAQISFVRPNAAHTDLEACPAADIQGQTIRYCYVERIAFDDLTEQDFLARGASIDIGAGAASVTRQVAYDNQGATPVDLTTAAILDLEGAGLAWRVRDDLEATLFEIVEGSAGGTSQINVSSDVDELDIDAVVVDIANGATINSGGTRPIAIGTTDGVIESTAGDLLLDSASLLAFADSFKAGSTFATDLVLADSSAEWDNFDTEFGEVSLLNAIVQAKNSSTRTRVQSTMTSNVAADTDVNGPGGAANADTNLPAYDSVTFLTDVDVFLNGELLLNDAANGGDGGVYPGTSAAAGDLRFNGQLRGTGNNPDRLIVIVNGQ